MEVGPISARVSYAEHGGVLRIVVRGRDRWWPLIVGAVLAAFFLYLSISQGFSGFAVFTVAVFLLVVWLERRLDVAEVGHGRLVVHREVGPFGYSIDCEMSKVSEVLYHAGGVFWSAQRTVLCKAGFWRIAIGVGLSEAEGRELAERIRQGLAAQ